MANVVNTAGSGQEEETTGSTPLSTGGSQAQPAAEDTSGQFSGTSGQPLDSGASAVEGQQTQTQSKKAPASSGMFTNIQKYVSKNRPQAQKMGQAVKQDVETKAGDIRSVVEGAQSKLADDISRAETARTGAEDFASKQIGAITSGMGFGTPVQTDQQGTGDLATTTPQAPSLTPDEETSKRYQELLGGQISGYVDPQAQDLSQQILEAKQLAQKTQQAGTEQGRQNLLKDIFRKEGQYTRGMSGLDQLIMAGDPSAMQQIADVQGIGQQLISGRPDDPSTPDIDESVIGIPQIGSDLSAQATTELDMRQKALDAIKAQYSGAVSGLEDPIQTRLDEAQKAYKLLYGDTGEIATSFGQDGDKALTQEALEALGLQEGMSLYGVDPSSFAGRLADPTVSGVMTKGELDKLKALELLSGKGSELSGFGEVGGYDPSKGFDKTALETAIQQKKDALKIPQWEQAQVAIDQRDQAERDLLGYVKKKTGKSYSSVEDMKSDSFLNTSYMDQRELDRLEGAISSADSQLASISKDVYSSPDIQGTTGGLGNTITGTSPSDLQFYRELDRSTIENALAEIARLKSDKLKLQG